ncbi:MAG TPA: nitrite/sulfite reductase [Thermoanaerobaculia bacterium]|nr:nitrite/sulfite reductase [Thermoanaerobaculia bacterium]
MTLPAWKDLLAESLPPALAEEIDIYETQIELRREGKLDEKIFAETRLRRGVYGQRYDNGQRHDGTGAQALEYPSGHLTKGPSTLWDAPGMQRIKIPFGAVTAEQLETLADLAEEYSDAIVHVTTRQDFQLHFVHLEDTPAVMRRLAAAGITTREACGNTVRNVTACPRAGVCPDETFDVTPYARALAYYLLGHKDAQDFGRKFKISFSGCAENACALAHMHDIGLVAKVSAENGAPGTDGSGEGGPRRGFAMYVGGGLGAVPYQAKLFYDFVPEQELLPIAQAICRVFARLGEKRNRARARLKFLVAKLGLEEFRRLVEEERAVIPHDERWSAYLDDLHVTNEVPTRPAAPAGKPSASEVSAGGAAYARWRATNVAPQRQPGYAIATVCLPLGDATSEQLRALAAIARTYNGGRLRTTVEQNFVLRWIAEQDLEALHADLSAAGLALPGASTLVDITACPGTDTCKLGISSSRGLASELRRRVEARNFELDQAVKDLQIKISGCFNSCGQHHVADIGFYGVSRKIGNRTVPHFQVILGGQTRENAAAYGLATIAVPSKAIPDAVERLCGFYVREREHGESFQAFIGRVGKARVRALLEDLARVPAYADDSSFYSDWRDPREYTIGDIGVGECAGEVVSLVEFGLSASERIVYEALEYLEGGNAGAAADKALRAMLQAAKAVTQIQNIDVSDDPAQIVEEFRVRFHETRLFHDPFAGPKFANFLFHAYEEPVEWPSPEAAHRRIEEAQLFIEAAHALYNRTAAG